MDGCHARTINQWKALPFGSDLLAEEKISRLEYCQINKKVSENEEAEEIDRYCDVTHVGVHFKVYFVPPNVFQNLIVLNNGQLPDNKLISLNKPKKPIK